MKVDGSCHCGQITFEADIDSTAVRICHCTDCQTLSSSAFRVSVHTTTDSGKKRAQAFCPDCGTPLYAADPKPTSQVWHRVERQ
jgi:hypothetical protein